MSLAEKRDAFRTEVAPALAKQLRIGNQVPSGSDRFVCFEDASRYLVVAGEQEGSDVNLAMAYGLSWAKQKRLNLLLPKSRAFPTLQRTPWLLPETRPKVFIHDNASVDEAKAFDRSETIENLQGAVARAKVDSASAEFEKAYSPLAIDKAPKVIEALAEWAMMHPRLDPAHRRSYRAWHCMGHRVLRIRRVQGGYAIVAGTQNDEAKEERISARSGLDASLLGVLKRRVEQGIKERLSGSHHRTDEHWLQAMIRRQPESVGLERPALREVPAWRPTVKAGQPFWNRGYIDLLGLDAHGHIRIVETKLASNSDAEFILQGLDYFTWSQAYLTPLRQRLGASKKCGVVVHYVVGVPARQQVKVSAYARPQAKALAIPHKFQELRDWDTEPRFESALRSTVHDSVPS